MISVDKAKTNKLFYVVSNVIIIDLSKYKILLLKRSESEKVHPGKWTFPGGKLEHSDVSKLLSDKKIKPIDGIDDILGILAEREAKEECGLSVDINSAKLISNKVFIRPDNVPVFMAILSAEYTGGQVVIEEGAFSDFAWVSEKDMENYDCIIGLIENAKTVFKTYR